VSKGVCQHNWLGIVATLISDESNTNQPGSGQPEKQKKMATTQSRDPTVSYIRWISQQDFDDVHTIRRETAERVLTKERMRIVRHLTDHEVSSVRDLSRQLDRNHSRVSEDLKLLFEAGIIEYEQDGRSKAPVIAHENIFVEPVVFEGAAFPEDDE
jgi:predicted transcriptional regulator